MDNAEVLLSAQKLLVPLTQNAQRNLTTIRNYFTRLLIRMNLIRISTICFHTVTLGLEGGFSVVFF